MAANPVVPKESIPAFLAALRSGRYTQGFGGFKHDAGWFCAVGVWFDVVYPDLWTRWKEEDPYHVSYATFIDAMRDLSWAIMKWNDTERLSFEEIADRVEEWCKEHGIPV